MKIIEYTFEGTPEEYLAVVPVLRQHGGRTIMKRQGDEAEAIAPSVAEGVDLDRLRFVTEAQATKIMLRKPLSPSMMKLIEKLFRAGEAWVISDELKAAMGYDIDPKGEDRFRSSLGAFGLRVAQEAGKGVGFFEQRSIGSGKVEYRLPQTVREALNKLGWFR